MRRECAAVEERGGRLARIPDPRIIHNPLGSRYRKFIKLRTAVEEVTIPAFANPGLLDVKLFIDLVLTLYQQKDNLSDGGGRKGACESIPKELPLMSCSQISDRAGLACIVAA